jgi:transcriptional regulator with PAS, ATPase and Fis domain
MVAMAAVTAAVVRAVVTVATVCLCDTCVHRAMLQVVDMAVQASETAVMITDQKGCILWANNALAKLACTTLAQLRGKTFNDLFAFEESDDEQSQQQSQPQSRVQSPTAAAAAAAAVIAAAQRSSCAEEPSAAPAAAALYSDYAKTLELRTQTWAGDSVVLQIEASHTLECL